MIDAFLQCGMRIGKISECLVLGLPDAQGAVVLRKPDNDKAIVGSKTY